MRDTFGREIRYLRVSVTDRCNLRCVYCRPAAGSGTDASGCGDGESLSWFAPLEILSYEEIADIVRVACKMGVDKVRVTGGEPLVRRGLPLFIGMLAQIPGLRDLSMTTNGMLLAPYARALRAAGLQRVNVSLDTVRPDSYRRLTGGDLWRVLEGISAARAAGLSPIKLNCVVKTSSDEPDAREVAQFARAERLDVRYIRRMNLQDGTFSVVEGGRGGDCVHCNRLRLSCTGAFRPCLFSDLEFSVREYGIRGALERAVQQKPRCGMTSSLVSLGVIGG